MRVAAREQSLDLRDRHSMLLTFGAVAVIPVKSADPQIHSSPKLYKCIYESGGATQVLPLDFKLKYLFFNNIQEITAPK